MTKHFSEDELNAAVAERHSEQLQDASAEVDRARTAAAQRAAHDVERGELLSEFVALATKRGVPQETFVAKWLHDGWLGARPRSKKIGCGWRILTQCVSYNTSSSTTIWFVTEAGRPLAWQNVSDVSEVAPEPRELHRLLRLALLGEPERTSRDDSV